MEALFCNSALSEKPTVLPQIKKRYFHLFKRFYFVEKEVWKERFSLAQRWTSLIRNTKVKISNISTA